MPSYMMNNSDYMPLILVPTPLGNLQDITLRALEALRNAALIVAEDTRVTRKLLSAHHIFTRDLQTYNEYTSSSGIDAILERAQQEDVAVVSDAGMPGVCDPGNQLLAQARERGIAVHVLPGPSAFLSAVVLSGFPVIGLSFEGFVPRSEGARTTAIRDVVQRRATSVWYESPHRIRDTLLAIARDMPLVPLFVVREYTKQFEQQILGTASEALAALPDPIRGEFVLVIDARSHEVEVPSHDDLDAQIDVLLAEGRPPTTIAKRLAAAGYGSRNELYRRASERGKRTSDAENEA